MYYYIFDIKKCKKPAQVEEIKNYLKVLGISGEFSYPTAAQTTEELVDLGIFKQYSTIVAIGGDEIANSVANKLLGCKEAMGFIPLDASPALCQMIGATSWKEACDSLRFRKISEFRLGQTASGTTFLTSISLAISSPADVTLEFKDYLVQTRAKKLVIANYMPGLAKIGADYLDVLISSADPKEGFFSRISSILGSKQQRDDLGLSLFRARSLRIFTKTTTPILSGDKTVAKTPHLIESTDSSVRLITSRKSSAPK